MIKQRLVIFDDGSTEGAEGLELWLRVIGLFAKSLSENRRGLAHFAVPWEQNVPVPLSSAGSRIGSKRTS